MNEYTKSQLIWGGVVAIGIIAFATIVVVTIQDARATKSECITSGDKHTAGNCIR